MRRWYKCTYCGGEGGYDVSYPYAHTKPCHVCDGAGKVLLPVRKKPECKCLKEGHWIRNCPVCYPETETL